MCIQTGAEVLGKILQRWTANYRYLLEPLAHLVDRRIPKLCETCGNIKPTARQKRNVGYPVEITTPHVKFMTVNIFFHVMFV